MAGSIAKWLLIVKFWTFPISMVPITVGVAFSKTNFSPALYLLMVLGVVSVNFAANMLNDIFDFRHGVDKPSDAAVMQRMHPLIAEIATERQLLTASAILIFIAASCGAYITYLRGFPVAAASIVGILAAVMYTAGRKNIKSIGLGEALLFMIYGPLMTTMSYFVESGHFSYTVLAVSIPVGLSISMILLANNIRDVKADSEAGLLTLPVRIGAKNAKFLFRIMAVAIYAFIIVYFVAGLMPIYSLIVFLSAPYGISTAQSITNKFAPNNSAELVSRFSTAFGILLVSGIAL